MHTNHKLQYGLILNAVDGKLNIKSTSYNSGALYK